MRGLVHVVTLALVLLTARGAQAFCGFYVSGAETKLFANASQVVLMREGTRTVLSMQNDYQGPLESFAMVVPVPVVLQKESVKTLPREIFTRIDQLDAPRLVEYRERDPCAPAYPRKRSGNSPLAGGGMAASAFVLTRLHARYTRDALGDDLVFKEAPPIVGGREVRGADGALDTSASAPSDREPRASAFQGRYAVRHAWAGPVSCEAPVRNVWGGPPNGLDNGGAKPAVGLADAPRENVQLTSFLRTDVAAAAPDQDGGSADGGGGAAAEKRSGCSSTSGALVLAARRSSRREAPRRIRAR